MILIAASGYEFSPALPLNGLSFAPTFRMPDVADSTVASPARFAAATMALLTVSQKRGRSSRASQPPRCSHCAE